MENHPEALECLLCTAAPASSNVIDWLAHENKMGHKPTETAIRIVSHAYELGCQMADRGHYDSQNGREPPPFHFFEDVAGTCIAVTTENAAKCASIVAQLLQDSYLSGYNRE